MMTLKILLLGKPYAGKTQLLNRYVDGSFKDTYERTNGVNLSKKNATTFIEIGGAFVNSSSFNNVYKNSNAAILVLDVTEKFNENDILDYIKQFRQNAGKDLPIVLVVNKTDLNASDQYSQNLDSIKKFFYKNKQNYNLVGDNPLQVSARNNTKNNTNVDDIFQTAIKSAEANVNKKPQAVKESDNNKKTENKIDINNLIQILSKYKNQRSSETNEYTIKQNNNDYLSRFGSFFGFSKDEKTHSVDLFIAFLSKRENKIEPNIINIIKHFDHTKSVEKTIKALTSNRLGDICKNFFTNKNQAKEFKNFLEDIYHQYEQNKRSTTTPTKSG